MSLLIDTEPTHRGDAMRVYLRENGTSRVETLPYTVKYFTREIPYEYAQRTAHEARDFRPHVTRGKQGYIVSFHADRKAYRELKRRLVNKGVPVTFYEHYNVSQMLRWKYPTLSLVEIEDNRLRIVGKATVEQLMQECKASLDIEVELFDTVNQRIYSATLITDKGDYIITTKNAGVKRITYKDEAGVERQAEIIAEKNSADISRKASEIILAIDPLFIMGHNLMSYDLLKLRDLEKQRKDIFTPGVDLTDPFIKGGFGDTIEVLQDRGSEVIQIKQFARKTLTKGRFVIDTYADARNNSWMADRKHHTVARAYGFPFDKGMDYRGMEQLARAAETSTDAAQVLLLTNYQDAFKSYQTGTFILPVILAAALDFETDPSTVSFKSNISRTSHDGNYYRKYEKYRRNREEELSNVRVGEIKLRDLGLSQEGNDFDDED